jgi:protein-tyrosine phosphatase
MPMENLLLHFDEGVDFIKEAVDSHQSILVHCNAGVSRSASFVIAYMMREQGMHFQEAFDFVK